ncbi:MAG: hypothetical protein ACOH1W_12995 [Tessaracoccus sp.]
MAMDYWGHTVNENGKLAWSYGVTEAYAAHRPQDHIRHGDPRIPALLASICVAKTKFVTCSVCGETITMTARTLMRQTMSVSKRTMVCAGCKVPLVAKEKAEQRAVQVAEYAVAAAIRAEACAARDSRIPVVTDGVLFDLPTLTLRVLTDDANAQQDALEYWDHAVDGLGRLTWTHAVADVVHRDGQQRSPIGVTREIQAVCVVSAKFRSCGRCGRPIQWATRSEASCVNALTPPDGTCPSCQKILDAESYAVWAAERARGREAKAVAAAAEAARAETQPTSPTTLKLVPPPTPQVLLASAVSAETGRSVREFIAAVNTEFTLVNVQNLLADAGGPGRAGWADKVVRLTQMAIVVEGDRFYHYGAKSYEPLPTLTTEPGMIRLVSTLREHAGRVSIGQFYAVIWRIGHDDSATTEQFRAASAYDDEGFALNRFAGLLRKSQWIAMRHSAPEPGLPLLAATATLFAGLGLNPITATPLEITAAVQALQLSVRDDDADPAVRTIVRGVTDDEYNRVYESIDIIGERFCLHTLDPSAVARATLDVLACMHAMAGEARNAGCSRAEAMRVAYFGLGYVTASRYGFWILGTIRQIIREALDGTIQVEDVLKGMAREDWGAEASPTTQAWRSPTGVSS